MNRFHSKIVMTYVKVQTVWGDTESDFVAGLDMVRAWERWADAYNERIQDAIDEASASSSSSSSSHPPPKALVYVPRAVSWKVASILGPNAVANTLLALALAFCVVLFATFNWIIAVLSVVNVGFIVTIIFGCFFAPGIFLSPALL